MKRVPYLTAQINGWAMDKRLVNEAGRFIKAIRGDPNEELILGGFGGSIYERAYWRRVLTDPGIEKFVSDYFDAGVKGVGQDYLFSGILYAHNGTMAECPGYAEVFYNDLVRRLAMHEVTVFHGFKHLYHDDDKLTAAELEILGPDFRVQNYGPEGVGDDGVTLPGAAAAAA